MIILWVRKGKEKGGQGSSSNDRETFRKHDEIMKKFRSSHPERELKITVPRDLVRAGGNLLVPVDTVKLGINRQN